MFLGLITLFTALVISSVAVYYSVSGLAAIFAGAALPIIIMGASLEVGKLVTASWLHKNWKTAPFILKSYLAIATIVLMFITSMGIFGFLSRAHVEQGAPIGDVSAVIETLNEKIAAKRDEIEQAKTGLKNLDDVVAQYLLKGKDEKSVAAASNARKGQQKERDRLAKQIEDAQKDIQKSQAEKLPLTQQVRKIETEVGPIKYIAQFIYGDKPNQDMLEKAVTWMIITIIFVFDPLAVLLLIAGQMTLVKASELRKAKKEEKERLKNLPDEPKIIEVEKIVEKIVEVPVEVIREVEIIREIEIPSKKPAVKKLIKKPKPKNEVIIESKVETPVVIEPQIKKIAAIKKPKVKATKITDEKVVWPEVEQEVENLKKKDESIVEIAYVQNSEQSETSLWQRVQDRRKIFKPMDLLYSEYADHQFRDIDLSNQDQSDPEIQILTKYVDDIKNAIIKFDDIPIEHREKLAEFITSG
jgi:hypothetical protein